MSKSTSILIFLLTLVLAALSIEAIAYADAPRAMDTPDAVDRLETSLACASDPFCLVEAMAPAGAGPRWDSGLNR